ncbi:MAG: DUF4037 domain-containing protein [Clostridia bacterium]|nr:DUF4037 domain-containing protein [Clostridia bacterium]
MRGLELSRAYFEEYGRPALKEAFGGDFAYLACGVCGQGSECFGFDDETSRDHDFDPGFFIWLDRAHYRDMEFRVSRVYDRLPRTFEGVGLIGMSAYENARHGVRETESFFAGFTGLDGVVPESPMQWMAIPSFRLATALNGEIFYDGPGTVTRFRAALSAMPQDVKYKKLAAALVFAAQSGQYNYARCLKHGERAAAALALAEFARYALQAVFLLNDSFAPFYKWMFRAAKKLPRLSETTTKIETLLMAGPGGDPAALIEEISSDIASELNRQGLSELSTPFLEPHAYELQNRIADPGLRAMHIMDGEI